MASCCAPACSQALPVKPQGVWARGSEAWAGSRDLRNLEFVRWGSSGPSSLMLYATRRDIQVLFIMRDIVARRHLVTWQQGIWDLEQIKLGNLNGCFDPTWHCVYLTDIPQKMVKVQFRGPELFKKNGALFQEELYLPGIFMPPWTSWRYDCGWMASSQFGCNFNVFAESFCHTAAIASTWQPVSTALPARGCHALQRVIGWDPGWELLCTCIVTSWSQRWRPKHGGLADRWGLTCHAYGRNFAIKIQCWWHEKYVNLKMKT